MENKTQIVLLLAIVSLMIATVSVKYLSEEKEIYERNYYGEYQLGLIPNAPELPATRADIVIAQDQTKEMIQSPFGYVYVRDR